MSRFESSRFIRNPHIMNESVLLAACNALNWTYTKIGNELIVKNINQKSNLHGEYAIKLNLTTNVVTYNTYYLPDAAEKVQSLQEQFYMLNAEYARNSLITTFKQKGFTYKSNGRFVPTNEEVYSFFMVGRSKDKNEDEPTGQIKFIILKDGTIVTDSDYLPNDVNELAHDAMDKLELDLGNKRIMTKRAIPQKYLHKVKPRNLNTQKNSNNE